MKTRTLAGTEVINKQISEGINSGLYVVNNHPTVIQALQDIVDHARTSTTTEQPSFNKILCRHPSLNYNSSCYYISKDGKREMHVNFLDRFSFPSGAVLVGDTNANVFELSKEDFELLTMTSLYAAHNNWIKGKDNKIHRQKKQGCGLSMIHITVFIHTGDGRQISYGKEREHLAYQDFRCGSLSQS